MGVSRTSVNNAVLGELGAFPLSVESNTAMITYYLYLTMALIASIIPEIKSLINDWHKYINSLIKKYLPNDEIQKYAYSYKPPDPNSTKNNKITQHSLQKTLQQKIKQNFIDKWLRNISECNKLEFYSDIKSKFKIEPYLNLVENRSHKNALTRLRISAHSLRIETGRYKRYDKDLKADTNTPMGERTCPICTDDREDEYHFLFNCTNNKKLRNSFFEYLSETHKEFHEKNEKDKIILLFHSKNKLTINKFAKFVYQSFQAKSKELTD